MQKRNSYEKIEDFLSDESFQRWIKFNEDSIQWKEWTLENTERAKLVAKKTKIKYFYIEHENPKAAEQVPLSFAYLKSL